jgi:hypothetical protein
MNISLSVTRIIILAVVLLCSLPAIVSANSHGENQPPRGSFSWECNKTITKNDGPPSVVVTDDDYASFVEFFLDGLSIGSAWQSQSESNPPTTRTIIPRDWNVANLKEGQHRLSATVMDRNAASTWIQSSCKNSLELLFNIPLAPLPPPAAINPPVNIDESTLACNQRLDAVNKTITRMTKRAESKLEFATDAQQKIDDFHARAKQEAKNYNSLFDAAEEARNNARNNYLLLKQKAKIDCDHDLKLQVQEYRDQLGKTKETLLAYKQSLKELIKAVRGEQND